MSRWSHRFAILTAVMLIAAAAAPRSAGAQAAYLQASPMGLGVYERMGFRTVETWTCFYPP